MRNFGYLNLGILTSDLVLEPCIPYPPSTIATLDSSVASSKFSRDSSQQDIHCLLDSTLWDDLLTSISDLFMETHIENLGDTIECIHLLFGKVDSSLVVVREHFDPLVHSLHDHSL